MATIASLIVKVGADINDLDSKLNSAQGKVQAFGRNLRNIGMGMTAGITAPLLGVATAADRAATALNERMGNVQSLGLSIERTRELKASVQETAIAVGKGTTDMADGLYQVVSAFGDSADTAAILKINATAAAAGLSTVTDAINLTSAVTKGYGDVNAASVQKASDLAFVTVKLGQTTFPELAASIGKVVPLTAALRVSQEELFAVMATATGVTGQASEVATQLRGILQSLMAPTADMTALFAAQGVASGEALLAQKGLAGSIAAIVTAATASGTPLQKYISSIEGQTLALALAGPLAADYTTKLDAMTKASGATDAAFRAQTGGINANGFAAQQAAIKWEVFLQKLGDGLGPAKSAVIDALGPMTDEALKFADAFAKMDPKSQKWIVGMAGIVAAAGPALVVVGSLAMALSALLTPVGAVLAGLVVLAAVVAANWTTISETTTTAIDAMAPAWERFVGWIGAAQAGDWGAVAAGVKSVGAELQQLGTAAAVLGGLKTAQLRTKIGAQLSVAMDAVELDLSPVTQRIRNQLNLMRAGLLVAAATVDLSPVTQRLTDALNRVRLGLLLALATGGQWIEPATVQGWWERVTGGIRTELDRLLGGDNVVTRSLATAQGAIATIQATMQGAGGLSAAEQFSAAVSVVTIAINALGEIKSDALNTAATAVMGLATAMINLGTAGVEKLDPAQIASAALYLMNPWGPLIEALTNTENLAALGAAYGTFVKTVAEKLGGVLASEEFGTQFGQKVGTSVAQLARGAAALVKGFMDQITLTDITTYQAQVDTFVQNFIGGVIEGIKSVDWSIVGNALKDLILFQIQRWMGDKTVLGLVPGPAGEALNVVGKKAGLPTLSETLDSMNQSGVVFLDLTRNADILNTELSKVGPAAEAATQGLATLPTADVLSMLGQAGLNGPTPTMDVAAHVVSITPPIGPLPQVDVAANVTQIQQQAPQFPTMLGLLGGAEDAAGSKLAEAASQLTSFSFQWPQLPDWTWPPLPPFSWPTLPRWSWPSIPSPSWLGRLNVPRPEWLGELLTWSPVVRLQTGGPGPTPELAPGNAVGTASWRGGWSLVGERGPELAYVPAGARIFNAGESRDLMQPGGGDVVISMAGAVIHQDIDVEALAYRVMQKIRQHRA